ncbi:SLC13 family permease [Bradyrhizobium sp. NP1]|uniref:SLC13 family permease n=1 Tax=Bradyrhizobium sp. NP1 TaxID=3049772 RepID=UPI0025A55BB1|nr:SLC13 family permease [Bradyrhizobium sp. NP1]WJR77965.1 SLC13 family permease [Bradyrhizobium sp. NP1]
MLVLTCAIVAMTIALWATRALPEYLTGLIFFALATVTGVASPATVFSGFASAAFWLVLSGFVLGGAIRKTGLADRMARALAHRLRGSYLRLLCGVVLLTYALAFIMPSNMGRIALLMPGVMALADRAGLRAGNPGRYGLGLAVGFGTFMLSCSILPSNVPNQVMAGAIEASYQIHLAYLPYLVLHAPVLGLAKAVALTGCIYLLCPATVKFASLEGSAAPFSPAERRLIVLLGATLALWMTDSLHGIAPAWVGLIAAVICLMPRIGVLSADDFADNANLRTLIYIAAILGLAAVVARSGLGELVGRAIVALAPFDKASPFANFLMLTGITTLFNFIVTANGVPALYTPLAQSFADATGLPLLTVLMIQVIGFSTTVLPYQAAPIVVALEMGAVPPGLALRLCLALAAITFVILLPLDFGWFAWLGRL